MHLDKVKLDRSTRDDGYHTNWVQRAFQKRNDLSSGASPEVLFSRIYTTAMMKFTDTTPGGNFSLNPIPQASSWTDPPPIKPGESPTSLNQTSRQGSFYSEMFDDHQQVVYFRFGVPVFNSITGFYSRFYNSSYARLVRTGGVESTISGKIGGMIGNALFGAPFGAAAFLIDTLTFIPRKTSDLIDYLRRKSSSLYYIKPTMPLYWGAAQSILNHIAVNKGMIPPTSNGKQGEAYDAGSYSSTGQLEYLRQNFPDIITEEGYINLYGIASRAHRKYNQIRKRINYSTDIDEIKRNLLSLYAGGLNLDYPSANDGKNLASRIHKLISGSGAEANKDGIADEDNSIQKQGSLIDSVLMADIQDGAAFVGFRVNSTGGAEESFSNTFRESELGQWINQTAASARSAKFSLNNGNLSDNFLVNMAEGVTNKFFEGLGKVGDSLGLSGLPGIFMGNAYCDVPKFWDKADTSFPSKSYTIDLFSPYGDLHSQLINIYAPLSCLLAGAMVRSTGRHSYTEPFYCQVFDKGRAQTRLGMIKRLSIQRGSNGNVSWTQNHEPLHIRCTVEVEDMESVIHMPLVESFGDGTSGVIGAALNSVSKFTGATLEGGWFTLDNAFTDYMAVLGSLDYSAQIYIKYDLQRKWRYNQSVSSIKASDPYMGSMMASTAIGELASIFSTGSFRR